MRQKQVTATTEPRVKMAAEAERPAVRVTATVTTAVVASAKPVRIRRTSPLADS